MAQAFARIGSRVTQVEVLRRLMMREDPDVSERVMRRFRDEVIEVRVATRAPARLLDWVGRCHAWVRGG